MISTFLFSLCTLSFCCFAAAKVPHYKAIFGTRPKEQATKKWQYCGWITLLLTSVLCIDCYAAYGAVKVFGYMALSVAIVIAILYWRPSVMRGVIMVLSAWSLFGLLYWILS